MLWRFCQRFILLKITVTPPHSCPRASLLHWENYLSLVPSSNGRDIYYGTVIFFSSMGSNTVLCPVFPKSRAHPSPMAPSHPWWRSLPSLKELSRVCLHVYKVFVFVAGSSQWLKWPIRNAVCLTVSRSQPEPPTVVFPQHPPSPTPPSSIPANVYESM